MSVYLSFYPRTYSQCSYLTFCVITCMDFCRIQLLSPIGYAISTTLRENQNHRRCSDMEKPTRKIQSIRKFPKVFWLRGKHINKSKFFCTDSLVFVWNEFWNKRYSTFIYACSAHCRFSSCCWQATAFLQSMYRRWSPLITPKSFAREVSPAHSELSTQQLHFMCSDISCKMSRPQFRNVMFTLNSLGNFVGPRRHSLTRI